MAGVVRFVSTDLAFGKPAGLGLVAQGCARAPHLASTLYERLEVFPIHFHRDAEVPVMLKVAEQPEATVGAPQVPQHCDLLLRRVPVDGRVLAHNLDCHGQVVLLIDAPEDLAIHACAQLLRDGVSPRRKLLAPVDTVADIPGEDARLLLGSARPGGVEQHRAHRAWALGESPAHARQRVSLHTGAPRAWVRWSPRRTGFTPL